MKISHSIVRIKKIESPTAPMEFDEVQLEKAAQLILDMEGVVTPVILRRTKPEKEAYTVIEGHFEYYAAIKAMEIDSRKGKTINAYIVESEEEVQFYQQQIALFRQRQSIPTQEASKEPLLAKSKQKASKEPSLAEPKSTKDALLEPIAKVSNLATDNIAQVEYFATLEKTVNKLVAKNDALEKTISQLVKENGKAVNNEVDHFASLEKTVNKLVAKNEVLEKTINQLGRANENALTIEVIKGLFDKQFQDIRHQIKQEVTEQIHGLSKLITVLQTSIETSPRTGNSKSKIPSKDFLESIEKLSIPAQEFLKAVNTLSSDELEHNLKRVKAGKKIIDNIRIEKQKASFQPFENIVDLLSPRISYLTEKAMIKILDNWS